MPNELHIKWGRQLRQYRKDRGLSLREVSDRAGISKAYYCYLEAGQNDPSTEVRLSIAAALGVRVEDIWAYPEPDQEVS